RHASLEPPRVDRAATRRLTRCARGPKFLPALRRPTPNGILECQAGCGEDVPSREQRRTPCWSGRVAAGQAFTATIAACALPSRQKRAASPDLQGALLYRRGICHVIQRRRGPTPAPQRGCRVGDPAPGANLTLMPPPG